MSEFRAGPVYPEWTESRPRIAAPSAPVLADATIPQTHAEPVAPAPIEGRWGPQPHIVKRLSRTAFEVRLGRRGADAIRVTYPFAGPPPGICNPVMRSWLERAAAAGDVEALLTLANAAEERGDEHQARTRWALAAERGSNAARMRLALVEMEKGQLGAAARWLQPSARHDCDAMFLRGFVALEAGDPSAAQSWWWEASRAGNDAALIVLGMFAYHRHDDRECTELWTMAADAGEVDAMTLLSRVAGLAGNGPVALYWLDRAARACQNPGHTT